jgi:hypothetical protein
MQVGEANVTTNHLFEHDKLFRMHIVIARKAPSKIHVNDLVFAKNH